MRSARAAVPRRVRASAGSPSCSGSTSSAIHRLAIGIALLIEYVAPLLVALWARYVFHEPVRRRIWVALALALAGLALIVDVRHGGDDLDDRASSSRSARPLAYTFYILLAEHGVGDRDAVSLLAWGFGFGALFWCFVAPWWSFPLGRVGADVSLLGHLSHQHLPGLGADGVPDRARDDRAVLPARQRAPAPAGDPGGIIAMLEPVLATIVAWAWLGESLGAAAARRRRGRARARSSLAQTARDSGSYAFHRVAELGDLLAAKLVALAALDAVEQVAHERRELDRVERLRHVVDAADVEPARTIAQLGPRGQEDDRDPVRALVVEQLLGDLPAVEAGHHHVEQDHVGTGARGPFEPARPVGRLEHRIPSASRLTRQSSRIGASSSITSTLVALLRLPRSRPFTARLPPEGRK